MFKKLPYFFRHDLFFHNISKKSKNVIIVWGLHFGNKNMAFEIKKGVCQKLFFL